MYCAVSLCWPERSWVVTSESRSLGPQLSGDFIFHYHTITQSRPLPAIVTCCHPSESHTTQSNKSQLVFTKISSELQLMLIAAALSSKQRCQLFSKCHVSERHSSCLSSIFKNSRNRFCFWAPRTTVISSCSSLLSVFYKDVCPALRRESTKRFVHMCEENIGKF